MLAVMAATMTFAKQVAFLLVEDNRYFFLWRFKDTAGVIVDMLILMAVLVAVTLLCRRSVWAERLWNRVLVIMITSGVITLFPIWLLPPMSMNAYRLWVVVLAACVVSLFWRRLPVVPAFAVGSMILSPLVPILWVQLLIAHSWSNDLESGRAAAAPALTATPERPSTVPIFLMVFDEWSLVRSAPDGVFLPELTNSRALAAQSLTFSEAWSYSSHTYHSVPAIFYQMDQRIEVAPGQTVLEDKGRQVATSTIPSLLGRARERGYHTALEAFYLPYKQIFGDQVEYERSLTSFPRGDSFAESMKLSAVRNLNWVVEPFLRDRRRAYEAKLQSEWWYTMTHRMVDESLALIDAMPRNSLVAFHWPIPHGPFVINEDGTYNGQYPFGDILKGLSGEHAQPEDYLRHLKYHDLVIGQLVDRLKRAGKFDDALIIMTGDHAWRPDPIYTNPNWKSDPARRHVPLIIKLPHQQTGQLLTKTVYNNLSLEPIIEAALDGSLQSESDGLALIEQLPELPTPTGRNSVRPTTPQVPGSDGPSQR